WTRDTWLWTEKLLTEHPHQNIRWFPTIDVVLVLRARRDGNGAVHVGFQQHEVVALGDRFSQFEFTSLQDSDVHEPVDRIGNRFIGNAERGERGGERFAAIRVAFQSNRPNSAPDRMRQREYRAARPYPQPGS